MEDLIMLFPEKHVRIGESIFGLAAHILGILGNKKIDVYDLWLDFKKINHSNELPFNHSYDNFLLAIDFLHLIGVIKADDEGRIFNEIIRT